MFFEGFPRIKRAGDWAAGFHRRGRGTSGSRPALGVKPPVGGNLRRYGRDDRRDPILAPLCIWRINFPWLARGGFPNFARAAATGVDLRVGFDV